MSLSWQDVRVSTQLSSGGCCKKGETSTLEILKGVSGIVRPGQFMAIMGASGAGKTSLLNTLAHRNQSNLTWSGELCDKWGRDMQMPFDHLDHVHITAGDIRVNGVNVSKSQLKLVSAYVQQDDYFIGTLTVREVMMFHVSMTLGEVMMFHVR